VGNTFLVPSVQTDPPDPSIEEILVAGTQGVPGNNPFRLPRTVTPIRYDLTLLPDLEQRDFVGSVRVQLDVHETVREIVCNAVDLAIRSAWVVGSDGVRNEATAQLDAETERVTFTLERPLPPGEALLSTQFMGELNDKLFGFYASTFLAEDGTTKVIATTQMEATHARKAFPCWDEPDLKAVFGVTLVVEDGLLAISNAPVKYETVLGSGKRQITFDDTMKMSTYLVAFVVGDLVATEPIDVDGVPLRIISRPGTEHLTSFALEAGQHALRFFTNFYGIPYPDQKLDMIATPDFAFGAMENVGAVTFRETLLLVDQESAPRVDLERIADVVSHEVAHMWFGNLVTMKWWNGLWLNEAFATFAETACCAHFRPEWDRWTSFASSRGAAQVVDGLLSTRPIEFPVVSPDDAEAMFDVLTYEKGGSVLRMLEQYLGEERFRDGVRNYLSTHSLGNAETTDLWDAIEETTGEPVRKMMDGWIFQGGYPLIRCARNVDSNGVRVLSFKQERFLYNAEGSEEALTVWDVPVIYRHGNDDVEKVMVGAEATTVSVPGDSEPIVVNAGGHGFYRVKYDDEMFRDLKAALPTLKTVERIQVVADTWALVLAGELTTSTFMGLVEALQAELDPNVWTAVVAGWQAIYAISDPTEEAAFRSHVQRCAGPIVARLGWETQPDEDPKLSETRGMLLGALGYYGGDQGVVAEAFARLDRVLTNDGSVDPNVVPTVISLCARNGDAQVYERFDRERQEQPVPQMAQRLLRALGLFPETSLSTRTLEACLTGNIRNQDAPYLICGMLTNPASAETTWQFLRQRWDEVVERFPSNSIPRMLEGVAHIGSPIVANDIRSFFAEHQVSQAPQQIEQHLERLGIFQAYRDRQTATGS
jgi:puromycin-sensitive aminopeptidase